MIKEQKYKFQTGFAALFIAILVLAVMFGIAVSISIITVGESKILKNIVSSSQTYYLAEAGVEDAVYRIKKIKSVPSSYVLTAGNWSVDISVNSPDQNSRIVTALSKVSNFSRKIEVQLDIEKIEPEFLYGAQVGTLGIEMENNSRVEGVGGVAGNIYSNGSITGSPGATITGNVLVATGISQDQTHAVYNSDQIFGKTNPIIDITQSFKPAVSDKLVKASIYIKKSGNPEDRTVRVLTDSAGSPSKTSLASATLTSNLVGTAYGWVDVVFPTPPNLIQGATYWLMVDASRDNDNYWYWGKDQNQGYEQGQAKYVQDWNAKSPVWKEIAGDLDIKTFMGGQATFLSDVIVSGNAYANTITNSDICGNAFYQTIDADSLDFLNDPSKPTCSEPLTAGTAFPGSPDPPLQNMPVSDSNINQWKLEAADGGIYSGDFTVNSNLTYGPKKINGNLVMTVNNKILTVAGTIYVTGYLDISNGSAIRCSASYGQNSCVVVVDGWVHISNNGSFSGSGEQGSYIMILSTSQCDGSQSAGCTHHNAAMDLHNNATGAIFYANDGLIFLHNGVEVSEITSKKIHLEQGAIIRYEQGLADARFSAGPGANWQVVNWEEIE